MNKILVGEWGRLYSRRVYEAMQNPNVELWIKRDTCWRVYTDGNIYEYKVVKKPVFRKDVIFRWGNRLMVDLSECKVYNRADAIKKATMKGFARVFLNDHGIKTPRIIEENSKNIKYPIIARPEEHYGGSNIVILNNSTEHKRFRERNDNWYYAEFFPKDRELRVHVAFGKVLALMEKTAPQDKSNICWNMGDDAWSVIPWSEYHYNACLESLKALEVLGLDLGAVDVMVKGEEVKILEVNTAPTLSPYTTQRYAEFFNWLFAEKREHWDFTKFKEAESFAWKHKQLK